MTLSQSIPAIFLTFPSELGYERLARDTVAAFAVRLGFDSERVENLKTALSEACINAIEHGNALLPGLRISVCCFCEEQQLTIEVRDRGIKRYNGQHCTASIDQKLLGLAPTRGMGLLLIEQLVDEATFAEPSEEGNLFRLAIRRTTECWKMNLV